VDESIIELDLTPCALVAPRGDLEIIFRNLIDNAVKYAGTEPRVVIELQPAERRQVEVRITDNGPGIPRNLRRKIFGRFVRLGFELERKKPGTGLGLYIVRTLVRRLRGDVRVHDPKTGVGTVFVVRLPRALASDREPVKTSEHPADATQEESAPPAGSPTCE